MIYSLKNRLLGGKVSLMKESEENCRLETQGFRASRSVLSFKDETHRGQLTWRSPRELVPQPGTASSVLRSCPSFPVLPPCSFHSCFMEIGLTLQDQWPGHLKATQCLTECQRHRDSQRTLETVVHSMSDWLVDLWPWHLSLYVSGF